MDGTTFANTKQHVADRQADDGTTQLFTNTKLNIALINDPKNGPRFTLTKREAGLAERGGDDHPPNIPQDVAAMTEPPHPQASPRTTPDAMPPAEARSAAPSPTLPESAGRLEINERPDIAMRPKSAVYPKSTVHKTEAPPKAVDPAHPAADDDDEQDGEAKRPAISAMLQAAPKGVPPAAVPPSRVPVDSSKTFIGRNGTYYDESWRWMDWRGTRQSWNWPAALSFGHWFAYRRLHAFAGLYLLWLAGLAAATVNNVPILALIALALLVVGLTGLYGNTLYFQAFRRAVDHITEKGEGSYQELRGQLAAAGGTSIAALGTMGALSIAGIAAALAVTHHFRGGFQVNLWPIF